MKRPEGVSAPTTRSAAAPPPDVAPRKTPPETVARPGAPSAGAPSAGIPSAGIRRPSALRPERPERQRPEQVRPERQRPERPLRSRRGRAPRLDRDTPPPASRDRSAKAEFRAAERARRRFERGEVKRFTRRARRRRVGWAVALGLLVTMVALVLTAVFSPLLALRTITVDGTSRLSSATLQKAVDGQLGTPLALIDYGRITHELAPYSLIRSYVTEVVPPDGLVIHVVERTPVGAIQRGDGFDLVDPAGVVVDTSKTRPTGYPLIQLGSATIHGAGFASIAQVLLALPSSVLSQVDTVTAQTHDDVTLTLTGSSQRVVWGSATNSDFKARILADLLKLHGGSGAGEYDVSAPGTAVFHQD